MKRKLANTRHLCKVLLALMLVMGMALTTGCCCILPGGGGTESPVVNPSPTDPTAAPTEPADALQLLRRQMQEEGQAFACAYLGYLEFENDGLMAFLAQKGEGFMQALPFLQNGDSYEIAGLDTQGEVYLVIPGEDVGLTEVYGWRMTDDGEEVYDLPVFTSQSSDPFFLICNTYFYPDSMICFTDSSQQETVWFPMLNDYLFMDLLYTEDWEPAMGDITPYDQLLMDDQAAMRDTIDSTWFPPQAEDLMGSSWLWDGYDALGSYYKYQVDFRDGELDAFWRQGYDTEEMEYIGAPWSVEVKDGFCILSIDFGGFAGVRKYNVLMDQESGLIYTCQDATGGSIHPNYERLYRYLWVRSGADVSPESMEGAWERSYTEVEGDIRDAQPGACTVEISMIGAGEMVISYTDNEFPDQSFDNRWLYIVNNEEYGYFDGAWVAYVDYEGPYGTTYALSLLEDGSLLIRHSWTMEGIPFVSYEWFDRIN